VKLFEDSRGFVWAFGFDMIARRPEPSFVCWCDPETKEWDLDKSNQAGLFRIAKDVAPEFVIEADGKVIAYQPGLCLEFNYVGMPLIWSCRVLTAE
jgi:hypothetical protein